MSQKSVAALKHFQAHYRTEKNKLVKLCSNPRANDIELTMTLGALNCLYWQALGNDLVALARAIRKVIVYSYKYHDVRIAEFNEATCL